MSTLATSPAADSPATSTGLSESVNISESERTENDGKTEQGGKRRLFGLLKKKNSEKGKKEEPLSHTSTGTSVTSAPKATPQPTPPLEPTQLPGSPISAAVSPQRRIRSPSPAMHSPASSLIFERNVQEQPLPDDLSSAIPAHIQTEDHIPAVLDASSQAITDDHLGPDEVEIVMHSAHQPAALTVAGAHMDQSGQLSPISSMHEDIGSVLHETEEGASSYGALDNADVRRLSFISFADVVQSEHIDTTNKEVGMHTSFAASNRSPSPMRSPASSHGFGPSPPTSGAPSIKGIDIPHSLPLRLPGSPTSHGTHSPPLGGELKVETMRQALRKTHSGDLSSARSPTSPSQPMSAVGLEDASADQPQFHQMS